MMMFSMLVVMMFMVSVVTVMIVGMVTMFIFMMTTGMLIIKKKLAKVSLLIFSSVILEYIQ